MLASRATTRTLARTFRPRTWQCHHNRAQVRFQTSQASSSSSGSSGTSSILLGGLAGGGIALVGCYTFYHVSGAKTFVNAARETKAYIESAQNKLVEKTPQPNEALKWLRKVATYYAGFIPGASSYIDTAFKDLDKIYEKHSDKVDQIVRDSYNELKDLSRQELSVSTAAKAWDILQKHVKQISDLAGDAFEDILDNHPEVKKKVGGNINQLKSLGEEYGPEAKKQVEQTWDEIRDIVNNGWNSESAGKIYKLVQDKLESVKKLGDAGWNKVLEDAKPYLDKSPQVKQILQNNTETLRHANLEQLHDQIKSAVDTGSSKNLEQFVKNGISKAQQKAGPGLDQLLKNIPAGDQILPRLQHLHQAAEKHGDEAKQLLEDTINELSQLLSNKASKAKEIAEKTMKSKD